MTDNDARTQNNNQSQSSGFVSGRDTNSTYKSPSGSQAVTVYKEGTAPQGSVYYTTNPNWKPSVVGNVVTVDQSKPSTSGGMIPNAVVVVQEKTTGKVQQVKAIMPFDTTNKDALGQPISGQNYNQGNRQPTPLGNQFINQVGLTPSNAIQSANTYSGYYPQPSGYGSIISGTKTNQGTVQALGLNTSDLISKETLASSRIKEGMSFGDATTYAYGEVKSFISNPSQYIRTDRNPLDAFNYADVGFKASPSGVINLLPITAFTQFKTEGKTDQPFYSSSYLKESNNIRPSTLINPSSFIASSPEILAGFNPITSIAVGEKYLLKGSLGISEGKYREGAINIAVGGAFVFGGISAGKSLSYEAVESKFNRELISEQLTGLQKSNYKPFLKEVGTQEGEYLLGGTKSFNGLKQEVLIGGKIFQTGEETFIQPIGLGIERTKGIVKGLSGGNYAYVESTAFEVGSKGITKPLDIAGEYSDIFKVGEGMGAKVSIGGDETFISIGRGTIIPKQSTYALLPYDEAFVSNLPKELKRNFISYTDTYSREGLVGASTFLGEDTYLSRLGTINKIEINPSQTIYSQVEDLRTSFHGSSSQFTNDILGKGLKSGRSTGISQRFDGLKLDGVYTTPSREWAEGWANMAVYGKGKPTGYSPEIFEVSMPKSQFEKSLIKGGIEKGGGKEFIFKDIKPEFIKGSDVYGNYAKEYKTITATKKLGDLGIDTTFKDFMITKVISKRPERTFEVTSKSGLGDLSLKQFKQSSYTKQVSQVELTKGLATDYLSQKSIQLPKAESGFKVSGMGSIGSLTGNVLKSESKSQYRILPSVRSFQGFSQPSSSKLFNPVVNIQSSKLGLTSSSPSGQRLSQSQITNQDFKLGQPELTTPISMPKSSYGFSAPPSMFNPRESSGFTIPPLTPFSFGYSPAIGKPRRKKKKGKKTLAPSFTAQAFDIRGAFPKSGVYGISPFNIRALPKSMKGFM